MPKSSNNNDETFTYRTNNPLSPIATVQVKEPFPIDLAFLMTVHKAQGHTIRRVIIDLTQHPRAVCCMKYAALFVAMMSRVATKDHIRLLENLLSSLIILRLHRFPNS